MSAERKSSSVKSSSLTGVFAREAAARFRDDDGLAAANDDDDDAATALANRLREFT